MAEDGLFGRLKLRAEAEPSDTAVRWELWQWSLRNGESEKGIAWLTRSLIESPSFVYRSEIGVASGQLKALDQFEIASELAFTFSGTGPSDELRKAESVRRSYLGY